MHLLETSALTFLAFLASGCASGVTAAEVADLMDVQREAWNRGDLRTFVSYYDATMTFCSGTGVTRGTDDLLARYERSYPTAAERGQLRFEVLDIRPIGGAHALVLGGYTLQREEPGSGFFSLLVHRTVDGLRILHDHTSETVPPEPTRK